jgi:hypothetical protein
MSRPPPAVGQAVHNGAAPAVHSNLALYKIGVLRGQCLDRRIDHRERLEREIAAWEQERNAAGARVEWMFTTEKARAKMGRAYPDTAPPDPPAKRS